ncbi:MAG: leucine-rich repeat protein, partial [Kiritimatiellae bacterium]|nr:leucine-rich repeat protein [Kiritimatiellia bacterium]
LADLGIARHRGDGLDTTVTRTDMIVGTPAYMSPEQMINSHDIDARADIYSLGMVLFEMLTGKRPREKSTIVELLAKAIKGEELPDIRTLRPEVSAALSYAISRMVAHKVKDRPSSALEAARMLKEAFSGPTVRKKTLRIGTIKKAKIRAALAPLFGHFGLIAAGVAIALVFAVALFNNNPPTRLVSGEPQPSMLSGRPRPSAKSSSPAKKDSFRTAQANGYEWRYILGDDGNAILVGSGGTPCISPKPSGRLAVPSVVGGHKVATIGERAFINCDTMTSIDLPQGLLRISGWGSFKGCSRLKSVDLPSSVKSLGNETFTGCTALNRVNMANCDRSDIWIGNLFVNTPQLSRIETSKTNPGLVSKDGVLCSRNGNTLVAYPKTLTDVKMPKGVSEIGMSAFRSCSLKTVKIPEGVGAIGHHAFEDCTGITKVEFPRTLKSVGRNLFTRVPKLETVVFHGDAPSYDGQPFGESKHDYVIEVERGSKGWNGPGSTDLPWRWPLSAGGGNSRPIRYIGETEAQAKERLSKTPPAAVNSGEWRGGPTDAWFVNWDKALEQARKTSRPIFVLNTGSDWCGWCKKLRAEVLDKPEFIDFAAKNLVLLYLDNPSRNPLGNEQKNHNKRVLKALCFGGGVPNVEIFSADGRKLGRIGGGGIALDEYISRIKKILSEKGESVKHKDGKMLFDSGYASLAAKIEAERAKLPPVAKSDFKARVTGVGVCEASTKSYDKIEFYPPETRCIIPPDSKAVFRVEYDFPEGYGAAVWVCGGSSFYSNPSRRYPGKGVAYGYLGLYKPKGDVDLDSIEVTTNSDPELDDYPHSWTLCSQKVALCFKAQADKYAADKKPEGPKTTTILVPRLDRDPKAWAYSFELQNGWEKPGYNDSKWKRAQGGFGHYVPHWNRWGQINTEWPTQKLYLRKRFNWTGGNITRIVAHAFHDDRMKMYLNGMLIWSDPYCKFDWLPFDIPVQHFAKALKQGENVIAIEATNDKLGGYFDCDLSVECDGEKEQFVPGNGIRQIQTQEGIWTVRVVNGIAEIGNGNEVALTPRPVGDLKIPAELDGMRIRNIARRAFLECDGLAHVEIPEGVRYVGNDAFMKCRDLKRVDIPESLDYIGLGAFGDTPLESIDIKNVRSIQGVTFKLCPNLNEVRVNKDNPFYLSNDGVLYDKCAKAVVFCPRDKKQYKFPKGIRSVYECAFMQTKLESVVIPDTVDYVGHSAFSDCPNLQKVVFKGNDCRIDNWAFGHNPKLKSVVLPPKLTSLDDWSIFEGDPELEDINIPDTVEILSDAIFRYCTKLRRMSFGMSLHTVRRVCFKNCTALESVSFARVPEFQRDQIFAGCSALKTVRFLSGDAPQVDPTFYKGANPDLVTLVSRDSKGWNGPGSTDLPECWPLNAGGDARPIRYIDDKGTRK